MAPRRKPRTFTLVRSTRQPIDFTPELQRVLSAASREVARELGRQAAREEFAKMLAADQGKRS